MIKLINDFSKVEFNVPNWGIKLYGGASFFFNQKLLISTRNKDNKSRISIYKLTKSGKSPKYYFELIKPSLLSNHFPYYSKSLGQSYPFVQKINSLNILFFTDWYYDQIYKKISNRLVICKINEDLIIDKLFIFKNGIFSRSGAMRSLVLGDKLFLFAPILKNFEIKFPNYYIHKFEFKFNQNETFESIISKISNAKGIFVNTKKDKTTCFNIIPTIENHSNIFNVIFSARNNNDFYNIYIAKLNKNLTEIENLKMFNYRDSLSYPSVFFDNDKLYLLCSVGRYGSKGLILTEIGR